MKNKTKKPELFRILEIGAILAFVMIGSYFFAKNYDTTSTVPVQKPSSSQVTAMASAMPNQGYVPLTTYFSAFGSESSAGNIAKIEWDLDANGTYETDATNNGGYAEYQYDRHGYYKVGLKVTDDKGNVSLDEVIIDADHPAADSVDYAKVFDDSQIRKIVFYLPEANWKKMWEDIEKKVEVKADISVFGELIKNCGLKMRGQFSLRESGAKKPFEFNTDTFVDRQEYMNLKQLMLINNIGDESLLRDKIALDMFKFAGVPSSNATFVELWIDITDDEYPAEYWGIYTMLERIDNKFIGNRFGNGAKGGNLYKASHAQRGPMDLHYYGDDITDYPLSYLGLYPYGKVNNEDKNDYSDVLNLAKVVDGTTYASPDDFAKALEEEFNIDGFLRYFAVAMTIGFSDFYPYTGNNYYLFNNSETDKFEWIPWDVGWDMTSISTPIDQLSPTDGFIKYRPLVDNVFEVDKYNKKYFAYVDLLVRNYYNNKNLNADIKIFHNMIKPYITKSTGDKNFIPDEEGKAQFPQFNVSTFNNSMWNLITYVNQRSQFIQEKIDELIKTDQLKVNVENNEQTNNNPQ